MPLLLGNLVVAAPTGSLDPLGSERSVKMLPCGLNEDPEWALDHLGIPPQDDLIYAYPDTTTPVRLYLIDSSVANPGDWIGANPKLTLEKTELIRGVNDPQTFSTDHATKMLSLIGGKDTGIAPGTPVHVVNYDVFPTADTSTSTLIPTAIYKAISDHKNSATPMRSVICLACSSAEVTTNTPLKTAISQAIAYGIPVVLSAGNLGKEIPNSDISFVPAAYGTMDGVICVGASDANDRRISMSNYGPAVDLLAPGQEVRVLTDKEPGTFANMSGTSPATALVAGAVLTELSLNDKLTPAEVENLIKKSASLPPGDLGPRTLRTTTAASAAIEIPPVPDPIIELATLLGCDPALFENLNSNLSGDSNENGIPDLLDILCGFNAQFPPVPPTVAPADGQNASYRFPIDPDLFDEENPFVLKNNFIWRLQCSSDAIHWQTPEGSITRSIDDDGRVWLTAIFPAPPTACFVRIEVQSPATK